MSIEGKCHTSEFLKAIGVPELKPSTSVFDPGYDQITLEGNLQQSAHLISILKISMACWMIAQEEVSRSKIAAAQGQMPAYLYLCADMGVARIEGGEGFTDMRLRADEVIKLARQRGLE